MLFTKMCPTTTRYLVLTISPSTLSTKQKAEFQNKAQSALLQRQHIRRQEQEKTIQDPITYSLRLQEESDRHLTAVNTTQNALAPERASPKLELTEADLLVAYTSLALQQEVDAEFFTQSAPYKTPLERDRAAHMLTSSQIGSLTSENLALSTGLDDTQATIQTLNDKLEHERAVSADH
ncbi:hypothetical protein QCA50_009022 [Cerrena zonata]|uniref:Uncharacterized protein n=1 Tax=Cerrena zonata TaxID=2478898 RepID=A0AAW0G242_9APHY